jgi:hypothetical protein
VQTFAQLVLGWRKVDWKLMFNFSFPLFGEKIFEIFYENVAEVGVNILSTYCLV